MNKVAIAFMTKDRCEQTRKVVEPLLQPNSFDLFWIDGSETLEGFELPHQIPGVIKIYSNVSRGPDAAAIFALTTMLAADPPYDYVGICENDVLVTSSDWFSRTMNLFNVGADAGLEVGAVSVRAYEDRVLLALDGYAVMHNLGYGMIIMTRHAARIYLNHCRTGWTFENRRTFAQLSGIDIGQFWAFKQSNHMLCADWGLDRILAEHGFASLALTPSPCEMIGQKIPLADQGLSLVKHDGASIGAIRSTAFERFVFNTDAVRRGLLSVGQKFCRDAHSYHYFPHQLHMLQGKYSGDWSLEWSFGYGPFAWKAEQAGASFTVPVFGDSHIVLNGADAPGEIGVEIDGKMSYEKVPARSDHAWSVSILGRGGQLSQLKVIMLNPGITFYALLTSDLQAHLPTAPFDHTDLPA